MFSCVLVPNPFSPATRSSATAAASSSTDDTPSASNSTIAFFGPSPGTTISSRTPGGIWARSASSSVIEPVVRYSWTFSPIERPTAGIARIAGRSIPARSAG